MDMRPKLERSCDLWEIFFGKNFEAGKKSEGDFLKMEEKF